MADVSEPAPIIIYIHGGGFVAGSKEKAARITFIEQALQDGVHFASINYRYKQSSFDEPSDPQRTSLPGCFLDGARAVQFLRANAGQWNIDPERVIVFGSSAGGGISLFLGANDDVADPESDDPVLRESSRVFAVGHFSSQPTYNTSKWPEILGLPEAELRAVIRSDKQNTPEYLRLGLKSEDEVESPLGLRYRSMIDMSANIDAEDPAMFIYNGGAMRNPTTHGQVVHHVRLSMYLEDQLKAHGVPSQGLFPQVDGLGRVDPYQEFYEWCRERLATTPSS
ncbi:MAG: alpha/beta hydrolase [Coraliomargarita sp.]